MYKFNIEVEADFLYEAKDALTDALMDKGICFKLSYGNEPTKYSVETTAELDKMASDLFEMNRVLNAKLDRMKYDYGKGYE